MSSRHHLLNKNLISLFIVAAAAIGLVAIYKKDRPVYLEIRQASRLAPTSPPPANLTLSTPFNKALKIKETSFPNRVCNIKNYGALPGGKILNTRAIARAIYACAEKGGGKVVVPPGVWLTGSLHLLSNIDLDLEKNATLLFSSDPTDYLPVVFSRFEGIEYYNYAAPIYAQDAQNVAVSGQGTLDGQGDKYWWHMSSGSAVAKLYAMGNQNIPVDQRVFGLPQNGLRPAFVEFVNCNRVLVSGVTLSNGPMWTIHPLYSQNVIVRNVDIQTVAGPATDGVDIDSSKNVLVENSVFDTGDDAIALKSGRDNDGRRVNKPTENVVLRNNFIDNGHGAVSIGSEMSADIKNVLAQNFTINQAQYGFRIKSNVQRSGTAENIWVDGLNINGLSQAVIQFDTAYGHENIPYSQPPVFQNIHIRNITCKNTVDGIDFTGLPNEKSLHHIRLENITIAKARDGLQMKDAQNITLKNISLVPKYGPVYSIDDSSDIDLDDSQCTLSDYNDVCLSVTGANSQNISLTNNSFENKTRTIQIGPEVPEGEVEMN